MALPLKTWIIPLKNMGSPLKDFVKIKASAPKNSIFFSLPLIPWFLNREGGGGRGGADIKCKSLFYGFE